MFLSLCSQWKGTVPSLFPGGPGFEKMGESRLIVKELLTICLQRVMVEESARITEQGETCCGPALGLWVIIWSLPAPRYLHPSLSEMIEVVKSYETVRKQWLHSEVELKKYKELLVKSDVAKAALEVKLKHARNQLDVEMKKRYKIEGDYQYLVSRRAAWVCGSGSGSGGLTSDLLPSKDRCSSCVTSWSTTANPALVSTTSRSLCWRRSSKEALT